MPQNPSDHRIKRVVSNQFENLPKRIKIECHSNDNGNIVDRLNFHSKLVERYDSNSNTQRNVDVDVTELSDRFEKLEIGN